MDDNSPQRNMIFKTSTLELHDPPSRRKRGRPRSTWTEGVYKHVCLACIFNDIDISQLAAMPAKLWRQAMREYVRSC